MTIDQAANTAIYHLQLNTRAAVRFVMSETKCSASQAEQAINKAVRPQ